MAHIEPITVSAEIATHDQHELRAVDEALRAEASAELFGALTRSGKIRYLGDQIRVRDRQLRLIRAELDRLRAIFSPEVVNSVKPGGRLYRALNQLDVYDCIAEVEKDGA